MGANSNASAFAVLEDKIAMLRIKLPDLPEEVVEEVAKVVDSEIKRTCAAGMDPYGTPWPTKKDGARDFKFATPDDVITGAIGTTVITRIKTRHTVLHNNGFARGDIVRRVIPQKKIPNLMAAKVNAVIEAHFKKMVGR